MNSRQPNASSSQQHPSLPGVRGRMQRRRAAEVMRRIVATMQEPGEADEVMREVVAQRRPHAGSTSTSCPRGAHRGASRT